METARSCGRNGSFLRNNDSDINVLESTANVLLLTSYSYKLRFRDYIHEVVVYLHMYIHHILHDKIATHN